MQSGSRTALVVCRGCLAGAADVPLRLLPTVDRSDPLDVALSLVSAVLHGEPSAVSLARAASSQEAQVHLAGLVCRLLQQDVDAASRLRALSLHTQMLALREDVR